MIIGLTGRIASGKGVVVEFLKGKRFLYMTFSDVVREETAKRKLEITRKNMQDVGDLLRKEGGANAIAKILISKMEPGKNYVVDGIRNPGEIDELNKQKDFTLIAFDAPEDIRFERLIKRNKPSDPKDLDGFREIDKRDFESEDLLGQQVKKCMERADYLIINDSTIENFTKDIDELWKEIDSSIKMEKKNRKKIIPIKEKKVHGKNETENVMTGSIIEESLNDKSVLKEIKIIETNVEFLTPEDNMDWLSKWTIHKFEINESKAEDIAKKISDSIDKVHKENWYADFKNKEVHYIIFSEKIFEINRKKIDPYKEVIEYGLSLGIPEKQLDFDTA